MGPLRLIDEIGVDVAVDIDDTLHHAFGRRDEAPQILRHMRAANLLGHKSGAGFYRYEGKSQTPNTQLDQWRDSGSAQNEGENRIEHRLMLLIVNEAARCLEEKVVASPEDADYGMILGTGFPAYRGGPLRFAENHGIKKIVEELEWLAQRDEKFAAAEILKKHARAATKFYES
jgi:3-hydroxyacyl-CoA dehydrogenase/enoyl-CoA hydratase/3-hydroxybutyryl-CoA epimerase